MSLRNKKRKITIVVAGMDCSVTSVTSWRDLREPKSIWQRKNIKSDLKDRALSIFNDQLGSS